VNVNDKIGTVGISHYAQVIIKNWIQFKTLNQMCLFVTMYKIYIIYINIYKCVCVTIYII